MRRERGGEERWLVDLLLVVGSEVGWVFTAQQGGSKWLG
jgi:hypothetical protein